MDHIVHQVTKKPSEVAENWKEKGFHAVEGGRHVNWGTHNALLYTENSYIEWLAIEDKDIAIKANHPLINLLLHDLELGPGFGNICIRTNDIEGVDKRLKSKGIETSGVLQAERKTTSGIIRKWKMLFIQEKVNSSLPSPFLIQWEEPDDVRYLRLKDEGAVTEENLQQSIRECEFHVRNPRGIIEKWINYFGLKKVEDGVLLLGNTRLTFTCIKSHERERLANIYIEGLGKKEVIEYEQAVYRFV